MSEPIKDVESAVRERGALPVPTGDAALTIGQRATIGEQLADAKPATAGLVASLAKAVHDVREHEHPKWEDLYCLNLTSFMGERIGPVLRRLLDAEARVAELEATPATVFRASHDSIVMGLYSTREAAQAHCEAKVQQEEPAGSIRHLSWSADDIGDRAEYELHITPAETGGLIRGTGYVVTPLEVAFEFDPDGDE